MDLLGDGVVKRLKRGARRNPDLALRLAASLGTLLGPGSRWAPSPVEIAAVLGERSAHEMRGIQRRMAANVLRSLALGAVANRRGVAVVAERVRVLHPERVLTLHEQGTPLVVVVAHIGPGRSTSAALAQLGVPTLVATALPSSGGSARVRYEAVHDATLAARFLRRAAADLEAGVVPILPFDGALDGSIPTSFLGRRLRVGRGLPFLAARGARVIPATARWVGNTPRIETTFHPPLAPLSAGATSDAERAFVDSVAAWFEAYVRRNPAELRVWKLRDLLAAEPVQATSDS